MSHRSKNMGILTHDAVGKKNPGVIQIKLRFIRALVSLVHLVFLWINECYKLPAGKPG